MSRKVKLKPCPFCGNKEIEIRYTTWLQEKCVEIVCVGKVGCYATIKRVGKVKKARQDSVDAWNVRTHYERSDGENTS